MSRVIDDVSRRMLGMKVVHVAGDKDGMMGRGEFLRTVILPVVIIFIAFACILVL